MADWLSLWDFRSIKSWDLASITIQLLVAISVFLICALVGPKAPDEGEIDLEDFFWRQRPYFYGALLATVILSLLANLDFLKTANVALFVRQNLTVLPMLIPTVLALVSRTRWVQWGPASAIWPWCSDTRSRSTAPSANTQWLLARNKKFPESVREEVSVLIWFL
jgi:cell division protein FtsW (lipid II flippase)